MFHSLTSRSRFLKKIIYFFPTLINPLLKAKLLLLIKDYKQSLEVLSRYPSVKANELAHKIKEEYSVKILNNLENKKIMCSVPNNINSCVNLNDYTLYFGTDKSSELHDCCNSYEQFLKDFKNNEFNLFEYGVLHFASLNMWAYFFKNAHVFGIDPAQEEFTKNIARENIKYIKGNAFDKDFLHKIFTTYPPSIIIDDATHYYSHQILGFEISFPYIKPGGLYIVEDTETSFGEFRYGIWNDQTQDTVSYFINMAVYTNSIGLQKNEHRLLMKMNDIQKTICHSIEFIVFLKNSIIIKKK